MTCGGITTRIERVLDVAEARGAAVVGARREHDHGVDAVGAVHLLVLQRHVDRVVQRRPPSTGVEVVDPVLEGASVLVGASGRERDRLARTVGLRRAEHDHADGVVLLETVDEGVLPVDPRALEGALERFEPSPAEHLDRLVDDEHDVGGAPQLRAEPLDLGQDGRLGRGWWRQEVPTVVRHVGGDAVASPQPRLLDVPTVRVEALLEPRAEDRRGASFRLR